jgi:hypothetical protein
MTGQAEIDPTLRGKLHTSAPAKSCAAGLVFRAFIMCRATLLTLP